MTLPPSPSGPAAVPARGADGAGPDPSMEEILASIRRILNEDEPVGGTGEAPEEESPSDDDVLVLDRSMLVSAPALDAAAPEAERPAAVEPAALQAEEPEAAKAADAGPEADEPEADQPKVDHAEIAHAEVAHVEVAHVANEPAETHLEAMAEPVTEPEFQTLISPEPAIASPSAPPVDVEPAPSSPEASPRPDQALVSAAAAAATASSVDGLIRALAANKATQVFRGGPTIEDLVREELRSLLKGWLEDNLPQLVERLVRAEIERLVGRAVP
jgi:cell pole-organizing protein PopZ